MSGENAGADQGLAAMTFEELVGELERVTAAMDSGDIGIEQAAELYSRAAALHAAATARLARVQARLSDLRDGDGAGGDGAGGDGAGGGASEH